MININQLRWDKSNGLLPAIVQDSNDGTVLMLGYMNQQALQQTLETNTVTFYSRSKQRLWQKGEVSGNVLKLVNITSDCDNDALLIFAAPMGPTCHTGNTSCFKLTSTPQWQVLSQLEKTIQNRATMRTKNSYTQQLLSRGVKRIAQKVGEEGVEVALAATCGDPQELTLESADLMYHLLVLLTVCNGSFARVLNELHRRS